MNGSDKRMFGVQEQDPHGREMLKLAEEQKKFDAAKSAAKSRGTDEKVLRENVHFRKRFSWPPVRLFSE